MRDPAFEHRLVLRLRSGDQTAVEELAAVYQDRIRQLAWRCVRNHEDAEEVAQDVLLTVCRTVDRFRGESALSSWIYRITFNASMSRLRRLRALRRLTVADHARADADGRVTVSSRPRDPIDWSMRADECAIQRQMHERLAGAVRALPPIYRAPIILRDVRGLSTEEASRTLCVSDRTLKSRLHRARRLLRRRLARYC